MWYDVTWCQMARGYSNKMTEKNMFRLCELTQMILIPMPLLEMLFFAFSLREIRDWDSIHPRMEHDIMQLCHVDFRWNHTSEISGNWYNDIFFYVSWYLWHHMDAWVINEWYCIPNEVRKLGWMSKKHTCMVYVFKPLHCIPSMFYGISWHHPEAQQCRTL